ncbi:exported hypothetical protein [Micromonospora lupini str. Lupac 08]|uniref:Uncharacterized protein n=1 Tax=Micromonospora lupini str. Lupac 08 TaxID=1150864 RepID=I0LAJ3_9ACTN|nr:exported hypothetical protein [Micromonospora lupini str. Lupac 08]
MTHHFFLGTLSAIATSTGTYTRNGERMAHDSGIKRREIMGRRKLVTAILATIATVFSVAVLPSPALAASWKSYTKNSDWKSCGVYNNLGGVAGLAAEGCLVMRGNLVQAVTIVTNKTGNSITIYGSAALYSNGVRINWEPCADTTLSNGYSTACFGPTQSLACLDFNAQNVGDVWTNITGQHHTVYSKSRSTCT